ncbi:MAG: sugar ABC transporter permease [Chloroflexi bacterium]|nr:sugar ABC transporter permease [Chloroflexota bacterium]
MAISTNTQKKIIPYLFLAPAAVLFLLFLVYPLLKGFQISFYNWSIMPTKPSTFIGLDNYVKAFQDQVVGTAFKNTLIYTLITVPGQMILAMLAAVMIHNITRGKIFFRTLYYIPVITSWVIVSLLFRYLFQSPEGLINYFLVEVFHITPDPVGWLQQAGTAMIPVIGLGIWKGIGWSMIIYLAALASIPHEIGEAASIDGANTWQRFWAVTLPLIGPTVVFTLVMLLIGGFNVFISVYLITNGGPMQQTEVALSYMYHQAFDFIDFGYAASLSFLLAAVIVTGSLLQMKFLRRPVEIS